MLVGPRRRRAVGARPSVGPSPRLWPERPTEHSPGLSEAMPWVPCARYNLCPERAPDHFDSKIGRPVGSGIAAKNCLKLFQIRNVASGSQRKFWGLSKCHSPNGVAAARARDATTPLG